MKMFLLQGAIPSTRLMCNWKTQKSCPGKAQSALARTPAQPMLTCIHPGSINPSPAQLRWASKSVATCIHPGSRSIMDSHACQSRLKAHTEWTKYSWTISSSPHSIPRRPELVVFWRNMFTIDPSICRPDRFHPCTAKPDTTHSPTYKTV